MSDNNNCSNDMPTDENARDDGDVPNVPAPSQPPYQKRKIDVTTKLLLAREAQGSSINAVAKKYDLARENIRRWIRCEEELEALVRRQQQRGANGDGGAVEAPAYRLHGGGRKISYEAMDQELADKISEQRASGQRVTRRLIEEWAKEMKERLLVDVVVCPTWVSRFMKRHGISLTTSGAVAPTDPSAPDQQRGKRLVVSAEDKLAILYFFETSNRDMQKTLLKFYGHIADPKVKQVKARNIYNWLHKRDDIAMRAHKEREKNATAALASKKNIAADGRNTVSSDNGTGGTVVASRQRVVGAARGLSSLQTGEKTGASPVVGYDDYEYGGGEGSTVDDDEDEDGDFIDQEAAANDGAKIRRSLNYTALGEAARNDHQQQSSAEAQLVASEASVAPPLFPLPRPLPKIYIPPRAKKPERRASLDPRRVTSEPVVFVSAKPRRHSVEPAAALASPEQEAQLELLKRKLEIKERQAALKEQKDKLLVESIRCNNVLKRIRIAEENMLARKRLKDAGISQEEIDALLPVVRVNEDGDA